MFHRGPYSWQFKDFQILIAKTGLDIIFIAKVDLQGVAKK